MKNEYEVRGEVTAIFLKHKGEVLETLISTSKLEKVMELPNTWFAEWKTSLKINRRSLYFGTFETKEEAAKVVAEARRVYMPFSKEAAEIERQRT